MLIFAYVWRIMNCKRRCCPIRTSFRVSAGESAEINLLRLFKMNLIVFLLLIIILFLVLFSLCKAYVWDLRGESNPFQVRFPALFFSYFSWWEWLTESILLLWEPPSLWELWYLSSSTCTYRFCFITPTQSCFLPISLALFVIDAWRCYTSLHTLFLSTFIHWFWLKGDFNVSVRILDISIDFPFNFPLLLYTKSKMGNFERRWTTLKAPRSRKWVIWTTKKKK